MRTATLPSSAIIDVRHLTVAYRGKPVLWDLDWTLDRPQRVAVIGPNGAGKSTLLKAILGLIPVVDGQVRLFGQGVEQVRKRVGYVPQRESVDWDFPVSVLDVVLMGTYGRLGWFRRPGRDDNAWAHECLARVGMAGLAHRQIGQLSGGQQQRTFLARALAQRAELYFLDEPMAGVDAATEADLFDVLAELHEEGKTIVCVHHDLTTIPERFDQVVLLNVGLIASGSVAEVFTPENLQQAYQGRLGYLNEAAGLGFMTHESSSASEIGAL